MTCEMHGIPSCFWCYSPNAPPLQKSIGAKCHGCSQVGAQWCTWQDPFTGVILCQSCSEVRRGDCGEQAALELTAKIYPDHYRGGHIKCDAEPYEPIPTEDES